MPDTTVSIAISKDPKLTLDYHINSTSDIAVSDDLEGNKSIELTEKF